MTISRGPNLFWVYYFYLFGNWQMSGDTTTPSLGVYLNEGARGKACICRDMQTVRGGSQLPCFLYPYGIIYLWWYVWREMRYISIPMFAIYRLGVLCAWHLSFVIWHPFLPLAGLSANEDDCYLISILPTSIRKCPRRTPAVVSPDYLCCAK